jgi:hypothetical protein
MLQARRLSTIEAGMALQHELLNGNTQVTTLVSLAQALPPAALQGTFAALFNRHPLLRSCIQNLDTELWFTLHDDWARIEIKAEERDSLNPAEVDAIVQAEVNRVLDPAHSLWRVLSVLDRETGQTHVIFTRHHAISDAHTTRRWINEWLLELVDTRRVNGFEGDFPRGADALPWPDNTAAVVPQQPNAGAQPGAVAPAALPQLLKHAAAVPLAERATRVVCTTLSVETSRALRQHCRAHGVSFNAVCSALLARTFCSAAELDTTLLFSAVSLRARAATAAPAEEPGCLIAVCDVALRCNDSALGALVRQYDEALKQKIQALRPQVVPHAALRERVARLTHSSSFLGIGVTNMGVWGNETATAPLRVLRLHSVVNRSGGATAVVLHLSEFAERLSFTLAYPARLLPAACAAHVANTLQEQLHTTLPAL